MKYTIGKMAKMYNISEQTLRLYDRIDLFKPSFVDDNQYRYYELSQCTQLDLIQHLKNCGLTLQEIKILFDKKDYVELKLKLQESTDQLDRQINNLKEQKRALKRTVESLDFYQHAPKNKMITLEYIPSRTMYVKNMRVNIYDNPIEVYDELLLSFKQEILNEGFPRTYFFNPGTILRKENLVNGIMKSTELFIFVDRDSVQFSNQITTIPSSTYLCIYCDSFDLEKEYIQQLLDEISSKGFKIQGDYICESINNLALFKASNDKMILRLQVPISF